MAEPTKTDTENQTSQENSGPPKSIRDAIDSAVATLAGPEDAPEPDASAQAGVTDEEAEPEEDEEQESLEASESAEEESSADTEEPEETVLAPEDFSDEWKQTFEKLPADARKLALEQYKSFQSDYTKKTAEIADVTKAIEPYQARLKQAGVSPGVFIGQLAQSYASLVANPAQFTRQLIATYQLKPEDIGIAAESNEDEFVDPKTKELESEVKALKQNLTQSQTEQQRAQLAAVERQIEEFRSAKGDDGVLRHPHFEKLEPSMTSIIRANPGTSLEEAYSQAMWLEPELRGELLELERKKALEEAGKKAEQDRKKRVNEAKKSSSKLNGKKSGAKKTESSEPKTLREMIREADKQLTA